MSCLICNEDENSITIPLPGIVQGFIWSMREASMTPMEPSPLVDVQKIDIDHVNVSGTGKSNTAQTLNALTPLLTVLITAIGLVFTFCFQLVQTRTEGLQKVDTDWRTAVARVSVDEEAAATGAFEMQSFFKDPKYGGQAKTIAAVVLPSVPDKSEFDAAFSQLLDATNAENQEQIISIAKTISNQIRDLCTGFAITEKKEAGFCDQSLADFVISPQSYFSEEEQSDQIKKVLTEAWKLDTVDRGLSRLWQTRGFKPGPADLSGIIFYNSNLQGVDLTKASMDDVVFVGNYAVDPSLLPKGLPLSRK